MCESVGGVRVGNEVTRGAANAILPRALARPRLVVRSTHALTYACEC